MTTQALRISDDGSPWDYRDDLRLLIDQKIETSEPLGSIKYNVQKASVYQICKEIGMDTGTLTNVLRKRRHFSIGRMAPLLAYLGYRIGFVPDRASKASKHDRSSKKSTKARA